MDKNDSIASFNIPTTNIHIGMDIGGCDFFSNDLFNVPNYEYFEEANTDQKESHVNNNSL